ncbi:MAG: siderophore-interacting protein [Pseudotabrizicola sp.]|uniref:siderophore-interacting protein n=1 Tax=Pseudotabrizicola sp. TaxID=2939647 RepID=UPI00271D82A1|nr:siderophore-interacting protein [Pseudotabrizicola sp.]MDO9641003.1 siderophore-interacting protein [Pseudotabrizicola sp.]
MQTIHAQINDVLPAAVLPAFSEFARLLDLEVATEGETMSLKMFSGSIDLTAAKGGLSLRLVAENERRLYLLQQMVMGRLDRLEPVPQLEWERVDAGALPPNLSIATVTGIRQISPNVRRVRVTFADIARYAEDGLHFRLVISALPPAQASGGSVREWPVIDASGRTRWPEGDASLHRPVYTVREISPAEGWMDFDVYIHHGGRVSAWTERAGAGDRIGLMGPTQLKRDLPGWVAFLGDETALPAIAMYLRSLPADASGQAVIACADLADLQDLTHPEGVQVTWIQRIDSALVSALKAMTLPASDRYVWFAAERAEAEQARDWLRDTRGLTKTEMNVTTFWSRSEIGDSI